MKNLRHRLLLCYAAGRRSMESETVNLSSYKDHIHSTSSFPIAFYSFFLTHSSTWHKYGWFLHNCKTDATKIFYGTCLLLCYSNQCCWQTFFGMESETVNLSSYKDHIHSTSSLLIAFHSFFLTHTSTWYKYGWFLRNCKTDAKYLAYGLNA